MSHVDFKGTKLPPNGDGFQIWQYLLLAQAETLGCAQVLSTQKEEVLLDVTMKKLQAMTISRHATALKATTVKNAEDKKKRKQVPDDDDDAKDGQDNISVQSEEPFCLGLRHFVKEKYTEDPKETAHLAELEEQTKKYIEEDAIFMPTARETAKAKVQRMVATARNLLVVAVQPELLQQLSMDLAKPLHVAYPQAIYEAICTRFTRVDVLEYGRRWSKLRLLTCPSDDQKSIEGFIAKVQGLIAEISLIPVAPLSEWFHVVSLMSVLDGEGFQQFVTSFARAMDVSKMQSWTLAAFFTQLRAFASSRMGKLNDCRVTATLSPKQEAWVVKTLWKSKLGHGEVWALLDAKWFRMWCTYSGFDAGRRDRNTEQRLGQTTSFIDTTERPPTISNLRLTVG